MRNDEGKEEIIDNNIAYLQYSQLMIDVSLVTNRWTIIKKKFIHKDMNKVIIHSYLFSHFIAFYLYNYNELRIY